MLRWWIKAPKLQSDKSKVAYPKEGSLAPGLAYSTLQTQD